MVLGDDDKMIRRAGKNIPWLTVLSYNRLSAHAMFYGKNVVLTESAVNSLNEFFGKKK